MRTFYAAFFTGLLSFSHRGAYRVVGLRAQILPLPHFVRWALRARFAIYPSDCCVFVLRSYGLRFVPILLVYYATFALRVPFLRGVGCTSIARLLRFALRVQIVDSFRVRLILLPSHVARCLPGVVTSFYVFLSFSHAFSRCVTVLCVCSLRVCLRCAQALIRCVLRFTVYAVTLLFALVLPVLVRHCALYARTFTVSAFHCVRCCVCVSASA